MSTGEQQINGMNFLQVQDFIKHKWGSDGWDTFNRDHQSSCMVFFEERMYPFDAYIDLLSTTIEHFGDQEIPFKIGWHRAKHLLLVKGQKRDGMQVLSRVAAAWHKFNTFGKVDVGKPNENTIVIRISDYFSNPLYCQRMMGFFAALSSGGKKEKCTISEESCVCRGDDACVFHVKMN